MPRSGADADALEQVGRELVASSDEVGRTRTQLRSQLYTSHWDGPSADRFRQQWDAVHGPAMSDAEQFLRAAGVRLHDNAQAQRDASAADGGSVRPSTPILPTNDDDENAALKKMLKDLGFSGDILDQLLAGLERIHGILDILGTINDVLDSDLLGKVLSGAGKVVGYIDNVIDFFTDFANDFSENANLPLDERLIHAVAESGMRLAVGAGAEAAADIATKAILSVVPGGAVVGFIVGPIVGEIVGSAVDATVDAVDGKLNIYDGTADGVTDLYRYAKAKDFDMGAIARDQIGNAVEGAIDVAENVGEKIGDGIETVGGWIGGLW